MLVCEIDAHLATGSDVATACRGAETSDASYYTWRKKYGGMGRSELSEPKTLAKKNLQLAPGRRLRDARIDHDGADGRRLLDQPAILRLSRGQSGVRKRQQGAAQCHWHGRRA